MLSSTSSAAALWSACGIVGMICVFSIAFFFMTVRRLCGYVHAMQHSAVAVTLVPVAFFLGTTVCVSYNALGETLHEFTKEKARYLPQPLVNATAGVRPLVLQVGLAESMWMSCLLFVAYGVTRVMHHLIDITRMLKVSRRRLQPPKSA
ncbi:hypothetical protein JKF63_04920 [Porcisia hertigi]|uniref:Uncharacterized protein n=1 Tax=Porcisia hertigi TaxID=2761500 RepID=A0A836IMY8_9TRYP|nr:hypothetical protein JKF63_04920 [Porcisia hertigi]